MSVIDLHAASNEVVPAIPDLPHLREAALATWTGRMQNEYASAIVFERLADQLARADWNPDDVAVCRSFAAEERHHGVLCGGVVLALGGDARIDIDLSPDFPEHEDAPTRLEAAARNLLSISCLNETVAVALVGAERAEMEEGELRALLTPIWSDEVGHSRFGWRILGEVVAKLDDAARRRLEAYLRIAFAHLEEHQLSNLPLGFQQPPSGIQLGLCEPMASRALFFATVHEAILPGLEARGLRAKAAWLDRIRSRH